MSMLILPIVLILFVVIYFVSSFGTTVSTVMNGGSVVYDEVKFQDYANSQYMAEFGASTAYEDNILLVFLVNEESDGYYAIAWVGDNIKPAVSGMFGNETTAYGRAVLNAIDSDYYAYSISSNLATVVSTMTPQVVEAMGDTPYITEQAHTTETASHLTNHSSLTVNQNTVDTALIAFTEATGIPTVIVVEDMETVFGKTMPWSDIFVLLIMVAILILAIWLIVKAVRSRKEGDGQNPNGEAGNGSSYQDNW